MALVNVTNVVVLDNPTLFTSPFQFEITFDCLQSLEDDLEWRVIYVGCSESSQYDQVLEEVLVGPVSAGCHKFVLQADAPDPSALKEILGVTVVLITCSYRDNEFVRIGYYVNNELPQDEEHVDQVMLDETLLDIRKIVRTTLADKPRVTRFSIPWNTGANSEMVNPESPIVMSKQVQEMMDDEARLVTDDDMELEI